MNMHASSYHWHPGVNEVLTNCFLPRPGGARGGLGRRMRVDDTREYQLIAPTAAIGTLVCDNIRMSNAEYLQAKSVGHIISGSEANICGVGYGYPWDVPEQANTCKARPN